MSRKDINKKIDLAEHAIEVKDLSAYATNAWGINKKSIRLLFDISFSVPKNKICAFIGHNGAGKTTTVKTLLGLRPSNSPLTKINLLNMDFKNPDCRKRIGYIPEKGSTEHISARDFLRYIGFFYGFTKEQADEKMEKIISYFKLPKNRLRVKMNKLSSGQNKIITICQAFIGDPELIIADEPTDNLDPETRDLFWDFVKQYHHEHPNTTFFLVTHNLDEIEKYTDYIVIINHGRMVYEGEYNRSPGLRNKYRQMRDEFEEKHKDLW